MSNNVVVVQANSALLWRVNGAVNIRKKPSLKSDQIGGLKPNTIIEEFGRDGDWIQHRKGWSLSFANNVRYITPVNPPSSTFWKVLDAVNVRKKAETKSAQLVALKKGVIVEELGKDNAWIKHSKGWSLSYVSAQNKFYMEPIFPKPHPQITQTVIQYSVPTQGYPPQLGTPVQSYPPQQGTPAYPPQLGTPAQAYPQQGTPAYPPQAFPQPVGQPYPQGSPYPLHVYPPTQGYPPQQAPPQYTPSAQPYTAPPPSYTGSPDQIPSAPPEQSLYPQIIGGTTQSSPFT